MSKNSRFASRGFAGAAIALTIGVAASIAVTGSPALAATDDFYQPPAQLNCSDGDVIRSEPADVFVDSLKVARVPVRAERVLYCSRDNQGKRIAVSGTILQPLTPWTGPGERPLVSYTVGTVGLADRCAPSQQMANGTLLELPLPLGLVSSGYTVAITDYEGLGTPGDHSYVMRKPQGQASLDMARAAQRAAFPQVPDAGPVYLFGASQGGAASAAAAELQPTYAPELNVEGVFGGAIPADLNAVAAAVEGTSNEGAVSMYTASGIAAAYPKERGRIEAILTPAGKQALEVARHACITDPEMKTIADTRGFTIDGKSVAEHLRTDFRGVLAAQQLGTVKPSAPIYSTHSFLDELIPYDVGLDVARRWCRTGATVQFDSLVTPGHIVSNFDGAGRATALIATRVAGVPAPDNCATLP
jgi:hypothetical protein